MLRCRVALVRGWDPDKVLFNFYRPDAPRIRCRVNERDEVHARKDWGWVRIGHVEHRTSGSVTGMVAVLDDWRKAT